MPLRQVLHKLLTATHLCPTLATIALMAAATACETDAEDIDITSEKSVNVLTSIFAPSEPISVYLSRSVPYSSKDTVATVDGATIALSVNGKIADSVELPEGETSVTFAARSLTESDSVTISANTTSGETLSATTHVMPTVAIDNADTTTTANKQNLRFTIRMTDPDETTDYYLMEVHRLSYTAGQVADSVMPCQYESSAFHDLTGSVTSTNATGIFTDDRLRQNSSGQSTLRLTVPWWKLLQPARSGSADSVVVSVRLYHLTADYYNFLSTSALTSSYVILPVFGSATVASNVTGGYGIVACTVYDERRFRVAQMSHTKDEYTILTARFAKPPISNFAADKKFH